MPDVGYFCVIGIYGMLALRSIRLCKSYVSTSFRSKDMDGYITEVRDIRALRKTCVSAAGFVTSCYSVNYTTGVVVIKTLSNDQNTMREHILHNC